MISCCIISQVLFVLTLVEIINRARLRSNNNKQCCLASNFPQYFLCIEMPQTRNICRSIFGKPLMMKWSSFVFVMIMLRDVRRIERQGQHYYSSRNQCEGEYSNIPTYECIGNIISYSLSVHFQIIMNDLFLFLRRITDHLYTEQWPIRAHIYFR